MQNEMTEWHGGKDGKVLLKEGWEFIYAHGVKS